MSRDIIITFKNKKPKAGEILLIVEDFFNGAATEIKEGKDRLYVILPGASKHPLSRIPGVPQAALATAHVDRWIELIPGEDSLFVTTRLQDEYTNALAEGLAAVFARWYEAEKS